ncbi:MAG: NAD-dependent epimerase/dehydratase family protein [Planctomycetes bacterium]|nr:NAD-dependent epimerase/dehydratase family protein [Planctomycetota bacterium]
MKILVTGGGGFLGAAIVGRLKERGAEVRSFSRGEHAELAALGVEHRRGDLADPAAVATAAEGCELVYHVAGKPGIWGPYADYYRANVLGTQNVLEACRQQRIHRLVYTSSPSVIFDGRDQENADESVPYPKRFAAAYPQTKAMAEKMVLEANGTEMATVALRPHLIWGPGDNQLVPRILARAKAGRLWRIGTAPCRVDSTYIDNAADAHLLAGDRLSPGSPIAGKAYFISQGQPMPLWDLVNGILRAAGLPPVTRTLPRSAAYAAGWLSEVVYRSLPLTGEPPMTRFLARELSTAHWFDIRAARRDLGYEPRISIEEGLRRLEAWLRPSSIVSNSNGHTPTPP